MAFIDGDDFVSGSILSFQQANRMKNHFRLATAPGSPVGGLLFSDSDDDKLHHYGSAWEEVLQLTRSEDVSPQFASLRLMDTNTSHYLDVIWNEDDSANRILNLLVNAGNVTLDIDTKEVLGVGQVLRENLLGNSGFGVWSQSDAAKGLASLIYNTGDDGTGDIPDVGDACTGDDSGATGKIISMTIATGTFAGGNATGVITLGAVTGCFNDNEALSFTDGETAVVNHPDGAVGADGKVKNGAFVTDNDPPNDWTLGASATLSTEAGGQVGNCLMITENGDNNPAAYQDTATTIGKIYKISIYVKEGTESSWYARICENDWSNPVYINPSGVSGDEATGAWVQHTLTFEAWATTTRIHLRQLCAAAAGTTLYFDEVTLYEITPCCTAADAVAFDGSEKLSTCDLYRQHDDATYTKDGSFYSLKLVPSAANYLVRYPGGGLYNNAEFYKQFAGKTVTLGAWIYASAANHARACLYDSVAGWTYSSYHTGTPGWEWLEITLSVASATTGFFAGIWGSLAGLVDGTTIIYVSQEMLVFGSYIGEGNYKPIPQEIIWLEKEYLKGNELDGKEGAAGLSTVAWADLNIEADSDACLPKGCKSIFIHTSCRDSGSAGTLTYLALRRNSSFDREYTNSVHGLVNNCWNFFLGVQPCDENGDIQYTVVASGVGTFDITANNGFRYAGVQVN